MQTAFDITADLDTPVSAFLKLGPLNPGFLLESVDQGDRLGRYSFIGFGKARRIRLDANGLTCDDQAQPHGPTLQETLRQALSLAPMLQPALPTVPFHGGLVGITTYEAIGAIEPRLSRDGGRPSVFGNWVAPDSVLVFDHVIRRMALLHSGGPVERASLAREVVALLDAPVTHHAPGSAGPPSPSFDQPAYCKAVERVKEYIAEGEVFQLVLSSRFAGDTDLHPFDVYRALRVLNPSPYLFYLDLEGTTVVGSSPEALVRVRNRSATLRPIAGTRPRGASEREDRSLEDELLADPKEAAEHVMLVDLARNDLGRVAVPGSIVVDPYRSIERYSHVMHIVSGVEGQLMEGCDQFDAFAAAFPAGTVVGAPKVRAMELIEELEPVTRGFYAGTAGYFGHRDTMDQAIAIRTMTFDEGRYTYQAGAGIVADSVPQREYHEVLAKGAALGAALEMAAGGLR